MAEQGIQGVDIESWIGFVGPAGMEPATVAKLNDAIGQVVRMPKIKEDFRAGGVEALPATPQQFAGMIRESYNLWAKTVANIGLVKE
jgi:tripartite-type tricarboxylate transporter receptor subunit TctC